MNRYQQTLLIGGIIVLLLSFGSIYILQRNISKSSGETHLRFIPRNSAIIIKLNGTGFINSILNGENDFIGHIFKFPKNQSFIGIAQGIDSVLSANGVLSKTFNKTPHYVSIKSTNSGKIAWMVHIMEYEKAHESNCINLVQEIWNSKGNYVVNSRRFDGFSIFDIHEKNTDMSLYLCVTKTNVLLSNSNIYLEDAIKHSKLDITLDNSKEFTEVFKTAGKSKEVNIFFNLSEIEKFANLFVNNKTKQLFKNNAHLGTWCELDLNLSNNHVLLNGFISPSDSLKNIVSLAKNLDPVRIKSDQVLPASVGSFYVFGCNDVSTLANNYRTYQRYINSPNVLSNKSFMAGFKFDVLNELLEIVDEEFGVAHDYSSTKANSYVFIETIGAERSKNFIHKVLKTYNNDISAYTFTYNVDNEISFDIYKIPEVNFCAKLLGPVFSNIDETYVTVYKNYLIFGNTYQSLTNFIYQNILKKTIDTDPNYQNFKNNLSGKSFFVFYANVSRNNQLVNNVFNQSTKSNWNKNIELFHNLPSAGLQLSEVSNLVYCNINWNYNKTNFNKPQTIWESLLDTTIDFKPQLVTNHYTQEKEIFLQDELNQIYLINRAGRILWKHPLREKINSEVYQIDYYKNKKLQLLFSSENYLHLMDRNGNYVERYPVKLRAKATAGMSLFDYDQNKNYRIVIPTDNKQVYMYSKDANLISGWKFSGTNQYITQPIQHFRIYGNDYIVFGDKYTHYFLDRRGNNRLTPSEHIPKSQNNSYYLQDGGDLGSSCFITTDTSGAIVKMYINGKVSRTTLGKHQFNANHIAIFHDITADGKADYLFLNNGQLHAFNSEGVKLFDYIHEQKLIKTPVIYYFSYNDRKIGLLTEKPSNIILLNADGKIYKGFPLIGNTLFSIGYFDFTSSSFNLIVGGKNNFLYNYNVK